VFRQGDGPHLALVDCVGEHLGERRGRVAAELARVGVVREGHFFFRAKALVLGGRGGLNDISLSGSVVPVVSCFFPFPCGFEVRTVHYFLLKSFSLFDLFWRDLFDRFYRELKTLSIASISWVCDSFILLRDLQYEYELPVPVSKSITCMSDRQTEMFQIN